KIDKAEARLDWSQPAALLARRIRAFNPAPVAFTELAGVRIKVQAGLVVAGDNNAAPGTIVAASPQALVVQGGDAALAITKLQLPGGKALPIAAVLNGHAELLRPGQVFADA